MGTVMSVFDEEVEVGEEVSVVVVVRVRVRVMVLPLELESEFGFEFEPVSRLNPAFELLGWLVN